MISVHSIVKSFGDVAAVAGVSFSVAAGEVFGLLGPNGAGKSTTISMVCGLLSPDSGRVEVDGRSPADAASRMALGVAPQSMAVYEQLSAGELAVLWEAVWAVGEGAGGSV